MERRILFAARFGNGSGKGANVQAWVQLRTGSTLEGWKVRCLSRNAGHETFRITNSKKSARGLQVGGM